MQLIPPLTLEQPAAVALTFAITGVTGGLSGVPLALATAMTTDCVLEGSWDRWRALVDAALGTKTLSAAEPAPRDEPAADTEGEAAPPPHAVRAKAALKSAA